MVVVYSFIFSIVLVHGLGLERVLMHSHSKFDLKYYVKNFCLVLFIAVITYILQKYIFFNFLYFMPFVATALFFAADILLAKIFPHAVIGKYEKNFSFGLLLFVLFEATSLLQLLIIIIVGFVSLFLCEYIAKACNAIMPQRNVNYYLRLASLSMIMLGLMTLVINAANNFFLNFMF